MSSCTDKGSTPQSLFGKGGHDTALGGGKMLNPRDWACVTCSVSGVWKSRALADSDPSNHFPSRWGPCKVPALVAWNLTLGKVLLLLNPSLSLYRQTGLRARVKG